MPINYLRLFRAATSLFQAAKDEGTVEPSDTPDLVTAHDGLMKALFNLDLSYSANMDAIKAAATGNAKIATALSYAAEGGVEFVNRETRRSWSIYMIGYGLLHLWEAFDVIEKQALKREAEHALSIWNQLLPVKEFRKPIKIGLRKAPTDKAAMTKEGADLFTKVLAKAKRDDWSLDEAFAAWVEGRVEKRAIHQAAVSAIAINPRDKWIYGQCCKRTPLKKIVAELAKRKRWRKISSKQGVQAAAERFAMRHGLPRPPRQKS